MDLCRPARLALVLALLPLSAQANTPEDYLLQASLPPGEASEVELTLEVGGELLVTDAEGQPAQLPFNASASLTLQESILAWTPDPTQPARSLRRYREATAELQSSELAAQRQLPEAKRLVVAEAGAGPLAINGLHGPLTREEADLIDVVADPLTIDRLLPGEQQSVGDRWKHSPESISGLLGLSSIADCDLHSEVTGETRRQVEIRLAGTVRGTIDGAATEIQLQGAYLFHLDHQRITKLNLAIKEKRKQGHASPGLDATAKLTLVVQPTDVAAWVAADDLTRAAEVTGAELRHLEIDASERGYRFRHDSAWLVTGLQRQLLSLRMIKDGHLTAHCNVTALPARKQGKAPTLEKFEKDIRLSLGERVEEIAAAKEWQTSAGHRAMGIFVNGQVEEVAVQWRYYLIEQEGFPQVSISVTVEQDQLINFADADRLIVDSLELVAPTAAQTARHTDAVERR